MSGKTVAVKHGDSLREIARVHITRIQSRSLEKEEEKTKTNNQCTGKEETSVAEEGIMGLDTQGEEGMVMGWRERKEVEVGEEDEGTREEVEEEREEENEDERDLEEDLPMLRKGNRVRAINKDTGGREEWTVLSLAGKRSSKCWADSYNVQDSQTGDKGWINLRDYTSVQKIEDEEEVLLGYENKNVIEAKEKELQSWRENSVCSDRILTCRIKSICSPAKGGTGCYRFNYQPGS